AKGAIVFSSGPDRRLVKGIHLRTSLGTPAQVTASRRWRPAIWRGTIDEPHIGLLSVRLGGVRVGKSQDVHAEIAFEGNAVAQRRKGGAVKRFGSNHIGHAESHVVKHVEILQK